MAALSAPKTPAACSASRRGDDPHKTSLTVLHVETGCMGLREGFALPFPTHPTAKP